MAQPHVLYISYDGMGEPLGESQVLGYLEPLAGEFRISLISFEKPGHDAGQLATRIANAGIDWHPLDYHKSPPILGTMRDILRGGVKAWRLQRRAPADLVHVRSYVAGCIALVARSKRLIFDIRGLWADERVEGRQWRRGGLVDRVVRWLERALLNRAAAVVTLTHASVPTLQAMLGDRSTPVRVIPTCTEVNRFSETNEYPSGPRAVWVGSIGPLYRFDLAVRFSEELGLPMHVLTRQTEAAKAVVNNSGTVKEVPLPAVAAELCEGDVGLCFYNQGRSTVARAPTRAAEYLAAGMPIAVTPGLGDLPELVVREGVGVVTDFRNKPSLEQAVDELKALRSDPSARQRCRRIALERFDRPLGVAAYRALYAELLGSLEPVANRPR